MSIFRFIKWITEGTTLLVYGDGSQERDFTYVEDIAQGTIAALYHRGFEIINLGSDRPLSLQKLIALLEERLERQAQIECRPAHPADVKATRADICKAKRLLGWTPLTALEEGLDRSVEWYKQNRSWANEIETSS
jgi:nucleoside-diphosphate-sugar epimerase